MTLHFRNQPRTAQALPVFRAEEFFVLRGVNAGDALGFAEELMLDDVYELEKTAEPSRLVIAGEPDRLRITHLSQVGTPGGRVVIDCTVTLMSPAGQTIEGLILVELDGDEAVDVFLMPLALLEPRTDYTLVGVDTRDARRRLAQAACVSFTRGTLITAGTGKQVAIEDLQPGDKVLTRDDGPQAIRWVGQNTWRATGDYAPVLIRKGALNNENDLVVSPDHRLFIYQREDGIGAGRSEVLVKARHLVNGHSILRSEGGYVEYFQLLFDHHQIIYAEGIAAESLLVDTRTRAMLPSEIDAKLAPAMARHTDRHHLDFELAAEHVAPNTAEVLLRASAL